MLQRSVLLHSAHLSSIVCARGIPVHGEKQPCDKGGGGFYVIIHRKAHRDAWTLKLLLFSL